MQPQRDGSIGQGHGGEEGRRKSQQAPDVEGPKRDRAIAVRLTHEQRGDQKPRQEEEDGNAEAAGDQAGDTGVTEQNDGDGKRPKAIQRRDFGMPAMCDAGGFPDHVTLFTHPHLSPRPACPRSAPERPGRCAGQEPRSGYRPPRSAGSGRRKSRDKGHLPVAGQGCRQEQQP